MEPEMEKKITEINLKLSPITFPSPPSNNPYLIFQSFDKEKNKTNREMQQSFSSLSFSRV